MRDCVRLDPGELLGRDHRKRGDDGPRGQGDQEPQQLADREEHEDAAVGAFSVTSSAMISAPVTAPPAIIDGITRNGSAAANRMAPRR